jgi:hypothetical protein
VTIAVGGGNARLRFIDRPRSDETRSLREILGESPERISLDVGIGGPIGRSLLLGAHLAVFAAEGTVGDTFGELHRSLRIASVAAVLTWFPVERGPFLRVGAGPTSFVARSEPFPGAPEAELNGTGFAVTGGVGYALRVARWLDLTASLDASGHSFGAPEPGAPDTATLWTFHLGTRWH